MVTGQAFPASGIVATGTGFGQLAAGQPRFRPDAPAYPGTLFVTDAAINIDAFLENKVDIALNAVELAHIGGMPARSPLDRCDRPGKMAII